MKTNTKTTFAESINWEWVHAHHPKSAGKVTDGLWFMRIMEHARTNGYRGFISVRGALRVINANLY